MNSLQSVSPHSKSYFPRKGMRKFKSSKLAKCIFQTPYTHLLSEQTKRVGLFSQAETAVFGNMCLDFNL